MANYQKLTLEMFQANLKEDKYETLTGARRAIGKTASWSAKEKEKARELANKHFGSDGSTKAAVKPAKAKKAAKKAAAAPEKKAAAQAAPKKGLIGRKGAVKKAAEPRSFLPSTPAEHTLSASGLLEFAAQARGLVHALKQMNPSIDTSTSEKDLYSLVQGAITDMKKSVTPAIATASAQAPAPVVRIKVPPQARQPQVQQVEPTTPEVVGDLSGPVDESSLSAEELQVKEIFKQTNPGHSTALAGLPRPADS